MTETGPPGPPPAGTLDALAAGLLALRAWAGNPSYAELVRRIGRLRAGRGLPPGERSPGRVTVYDCFRPGRRRIDVELVVDIVRALTDDEQAAGRWRDACRDTLSPPPSTPGHARTGLPADPPAFTGRVADLDRVLAALADGHCLVAGMPGVGKSHLAVRAAHAVLRAAPDTRPLFVGLRGYDPEAPPAAPESVLAEVLLLLGAPADQVRRLTPEDRAALYQRLLADRETLLVLDDAAGTDQVRPLLPTGPGCRVLVTSRRHLADLDATHVPLDVFTAAEALDLLAGATGTDRLAAEPDAARRIAELCGHLPLDLAVTGADLARQAHWTLADHVIRIAALPRDEAVRPALAASYATLPDGQRELFRLLALHPGPDVTPDAAAALAGVDPDEGGALLRRLHAENLVQEGAPGRYRMHDLVRAHARRLAHVEEPHSRQHAAVTRLLDHLTHAAGTADALAFPQGRTPGTPALPGVTDQAGAVRWFTDERAVLVAAARHAAEHGWSDHACRLAAHLERHLEVSGHYPDAEVLHTAARRLGDPGQRIRAAVALGRTCELTGRYDEAIGHQTDALGMARAAGDRTQEAYAHGNLGNLSAQLGRFPAAIDHYERVLEVTRSTGDRITESRVSGNLANVYSSVGRYREAVATLRHNLAEFASLGDQVSVGIWHFNLGMVLERLGHYDEALDHHTRGLELARENGYRRGEGGSTNCLGIVYASLGRTTLAVEHHLRALDIAREVGARDNECSAWTCLGFAYGLLGRHEEALESHRAALAIALDTGARRLEVVARNGLGEACHALGDEAGAVAEHRRVLAVDMGDPYEQARAHRGLGAALPGAEGAAHRERAREAYTRLGVPVPE
ncbi:tetratricopeptide repeat protein [Longispora sp. NPDC051575]|uniref:ATP-binding protein n=1 Tax=Longispora sp. NPDC051575 TaxID=3154943 RepID=UPI003434AA68